MCTAAPDVVNNRGDKLGDAINATDSIKPDKSVNGGMIGDRIAKLVGYDKMMSGKTPMERAEFLNNWLTGGGMPKKKDPGEIFGDEQKLSGIHAKAAAGQGIGGLFGAGLLIGDLVPKVGPLTPAGGTNAASPMQPGVPYSATPLIKMGGR